MSGNESSDTIDVTNPETTPLFRSSPERIGLAIGDELEDWMYEFYDANDAVTWYSEAEGDPVSVCIHYVRADLYESLQSQLAAANERADGLQRIVDAAMAQKPVYLFRRRGLDNFCTCDRERYLECKELPKLFEVWELYTAAPVPAQPAVVPEIFPGTTDALAKLSIKPEE